MIVCHTIVACANFNIAAELNVSNIQGKGISGISLNCFQFTLLSDHISLVRIHEFCRFRWSVELAI